MRSYTIMSPLSKAEYRTTIAPRYQKSSKREKSIILDEFCLVCSYNRKYAIRLLNSEIKKKNPIKQKKRGRKKTYDDPLILDITKNIWSKTNLPCSKRLKQLMPLWIPHYDYEIPPHILKLLSTISPATMDRLMAPIRAKFNKTGLATTKPGSILKKHIPIKTVQWDETKPGFIEADTVAHCGTSTAGSFAYTINCVDIATQWTQQRATWGKGEQGVLNAIKDIESNFPFNLKGFDCDNGSEFLNWHLVRYFTKRKHPVQFTRSRAYHKNDNAHIENKNWTHIRQYLGYQRFENEQLVAMLNNLYTNEWNLYFNFFIPSFKLIRKDRHGSKIKKIHDKPKTPFQRLCESHEISEDVKQQLNTLFNTLNPFELQKQMHLKIKAILKIVNNEK